MEDIDALKARAKKLNAQATQAKMDLHDLSEELPTNWEQILEVAQRAYDAHKNLMAARKDLAAASA
ncbi:MAG: CCE_0567 family metalloprotein [Zoogloea sp.]|uniref:CCE_0567 family metalloprotein n=1 Tax=Zoogloea sp. TaxID=49181 RepID=UPI002601CD28|nr:CCE_0567 family metalloprotein [Zoogloea sp.]MDD2991544.1 CCE_0567 family metalloprotein [Zoogloea sp.]